MEGEFTFKIVCRFPGLVDTYFIVQPKFEGNHMKMQEKKKVNGITYLFFLPHMTQTNKQTNDLKN